MRIDNIILYNYRLYKGLNQVAFPKDEKRNIFIIYGENGFGKTTVLQSLMWCLYGRMIKDVDDLSRSEINTKGYENYLRDCLNVEVGRETFETGKKYYIEIQISELQIPTMPSADLLVRRSYDVVKNKEIFELFIDGHENELARQIGYDVFVNDFVLSKDIARLFFFDSERIVKLAEGQSKEERVRLGAAYNHVIGIKKYEELKANLENILIKMKRDSLDEAGEENWNRLIAELRGSESELEILDQEIAEANEKKDAHQHEASIIQEQLLREGSIIDLEAKKQAVVERETCVKRNLDFKNQLKDYLDYVPFAIAGNLFREAVQIAEHDYKVAESKNSFVRQNETIDAIKSKLDWILSQTDMAANNKDLLLRQIETMLSEYHVESVNEPVLLEMDKEAHNQMESISTMLYTTFKTDFKAKFEEYKRNKQQIERLNKLLRRTAEEDGDEKIVALKKQLASLQHIIAEQDRLVLDLSVKKATVTLDLQKLKKQYDSYQVSLKVREDNNEKSELTTILIDELSDYLHQLRLMKSKSIERRIKRILNTLMHKSDFVDRVQLFTENGDFDVRLFSSDVEIHKNALSKGEQQLYATALLMALVEESGIVFPVFIDSPLQKFDKKHAERIIMDFYPKVSSQVVLLPIADKELTQEEETLVMPMVREQYRIVNNGMHSIIEKVCSNI